MTPWLLALSLCRALDASSSIAAFNAGAPEMTPWMPQRPKWVVTVSVGLGVGQSVLLKRLSKEHPTRARVIAGVAAGIECAAGANNIWQLQRSRR